MERYGHIDGADVHRITLQHGNGPRIRVLTFGGIIEGIEVPDRAGSRANVVLGLTDLDGYATRSPHFGAITGRYANRIARGRFTLDGTEHQLACNDPPNALHGGPHGFGKRVWTARDIRPDHVTLAYTSRDNEEGYPGTLVTTVSYAAEADGLRIGYRATTDRATVLNLTNHSYFNLAGEGEGDVLGHVLQVHADRFVPVDATGIPEGPLLPVEGTPFDFRAAQPIGARLRSGHEQLLRTGGYDHTLVFEAGAGLRPAAVLHHSGSGRTLHLLTDQPGVQLYSGNKLAGTLVGPSGRAYRSGDGVCLETHHFPDSPNRPDFPPTVLRPGEAFESTTLLRFTVD